jgi:dihydrofolate synthase/folylpolyglutamate synthase
MITTFKNNTIWKNVSSTKTIFKIIFPVINVVGTNGKGSVSNLLSHGFQSKYQKVGLFVSPAFLYHNERIQINNVPISDEDLMRHIKNVEADIKKYSLTFFWDLNFDCHQLFCWKQNWFCHHRSWNRWT